MRSELQTVGGIWIDMDWMVMGHGGGKRKARMVYGDLNTPRDTCTCNATNYKQ
jgi:hypothetical protein